MNQSESHLRELNPENPLSEDGRIEVAALADRQRRANTRLMKAITFVGNQVEDGLKILPQGVRSQIDSAARSALENSFRVARASRSGKLAQTGRSAQFHKVAGAITGALGGAGGLPTALAELPVATTVIFRAVLQVAEEYGEDPEAEETRIECLRVFGAGGPGDGDDGIDTSFIGARMSLSGSALQSLLSKIAPRFGFVVSQKLAAQAVPVLGAVAGAGTNYAFVHYYTEMAHVHFGLRRLMRHYNGDQVLDAFHGQPPVPQERPAP